MALDKQTKSVLFSEGMGDGTDRFLLEAPAIDYAENLRVDKQGSLQKRPGFGPDALGTVPTTGSPGIIHAIGDALHVVADDGVFTYEGGSWETQTIPGFLGDINVIAEAPAQAGMGHVDTAWFDPYWIIAYEIRERSSTDATQGVYTETPKMVVVQSYTSEGNYIGQSTIDNARSPKLFIETLGVPRIHVVYQEIPEVGPQELAWREIDPSTSRLTFVADTGVVPSPTYALEGHSQKKDYGPLSEQYMWTTRFGAKADGHARYHLVYDSSASRLVVCWQEDGDIILGRFSVGTGFNTRKITVNALPAADGLAYEPLDVVVLSENTYAVLYAGHKSGDYSLYVAGAYSSLFLAKVNLWDAGGSVLDTETLKAELALANEDTPATLWTHGGLAVDPDDSDRLAWFAHSSGQAVGTRYDTTGPEDPVNWHAVRDWNCGTYYGQLNASTWTETAAEQLLPHHRLATRPFYFSGELYACVQQWFDQTPYSRKWEIFDNSATMLPAFLPKSTVVCHFDTSTDRVTAVGSIDPGISKVSEEVESEFVTHLPHVVVEDDVSFVVPNRTQVTAEDASLFLVRNDISANFRVRLGNAEAPAEAQCRLHRVFKTGSSSGASFGDGLVLSRSTPMWFDGRFIGELGPFDAPQIIRVEDARVRELWDADTGDLFSNQLLKYPLQGYAADDKSADASWRKFNIIMGYYDAHGNVHRSAPSSTLWVHGLTAAKAAENDDVEGGSGRPNSWVGQDVKVYFTWPLSVLPSSIDYFVEVYVSQNSDDDVQLVDTAPVSVQSLSDPADLNVQVQVVRWGGKFTSSAPSYMLHQPSTKTLYTSGGGLAADPWPAFAISTVSSTRLWAIDPTNKGRVIYSKLFEDFIAPEYNPTLSINLGDERNLTAIGKLDDKVVVFEPNDIHVIYGEGPDNRGQGQDFAVHYISTDVGCTDQESVVETPIGLIFYSKPRGFYLLDRNLQIQFIGEGIEDTAYDIDILSAQLVKDKAEVRFAYTGGPYSWDRLGPGPDTLAIERPPRPVFTNAGAFGDNALTFNYERKTWMTYTNYDAQASTIYQNRYTMLRSDWSVWQEQIDRWDDPTGYNLTKLVTPWIKLSENIQGFNRLWRMTVLGRYLSSLQDLGTDEFEGGDIRVRVYFDYEAYHQQEKTFRLQDFVRNPFNASTLDEHHDRAERLQFEITPQRGRCQAVKLEISENPTAAVAEGITYKQGRGFEIVALDLHVGVSPMRALLPKAVK